MRSTCREEKYFGITGVGGGGRSCPGNGITVCLSHCQDMSHKKLSRQNATKNVITNCYNKQKQNKLHFMFTARKWNLGQGNVFRPVCQSFCSLMPCILGKCTWKTAFFKTEIGLQGWNRWQKFKRIFPVCIHHINLREFMRNLQEFMGFCSNLYISHKWCPFKVRGS